MHCLVLRLMIAYPVSPSDTPPSASPHEDVTNDNEQFGAPPTPITRGDVVSLKKVVQQRTKRAKEAQQMAAISNQLLHTTVAEMFEMKTYCPPVLTVLGDLFFVPPGARALPLNYDHIISD